MNVKIHTKNGCHQVTTQSHSNILLAALSNRVNLPYACATGTCGSCKATLISGYVEDHWPNALGKAKLKGGTNDILLCQCTPQTDCEIEIPSFVYQADPGAPFPKQYDGIITRWKIMARDVAMWDVQLSGNCEFNAGQFALIRLANVEGFRAYSMVNFDRQAKKLTFVIKRKPNGILTENLFSQDPVGKAVEVIAPLGCATFSPSLQRNVLCVAGGSGIAGIISILSRATQEGYFAQHKGYVFFGIRTMQDAFFLDDLSTFKRSAGKNLQIVVGLSEERATIDEKATYPLLTFESGLIHEIAGKHMAGNHKNLQVYLAGPTPSVDAAIKQLVIDAKLDPTCIAYDKFS